MPNLPLPETIAAIDLGSNSFHMIVAQPRDGELLIVDRIRDMVRLAADFDEQRGLAPEARLRALECLARFGQRLRHFSPGSVRAVGTNTLRSTPDSEEFLAEAEQALGHPIEVIAGVEEARLIYQGVSHSIAEDGRRRLVIDIGGGSTELIIGERFEPVCMQSTSMGCVTMSQRHFSEAITARKMRAAEIDALMQLEPLQSQYRQLGWADAIGASGTIRTIDRVIRESGWSNEGITLEALKRLSESLVKAGQISKIKLPGLSAKRMAIFPGGVAILRATFEALAIERMRASDGALREGLLYDLVGRLRQEDVRQRAVEGLAARHGTDQQQAERVEQTARRMLRQVAEPWSLGGESAQQLLGWAAQLHEVGLSIAHNQYHRHGGYILENADLPGFSRQDQNVLAALVRGHRRKFPTSVFKALPTRKASMAQQLSVLLRLAATLHRSRTPTPLPDLVLKAKGHQLSLHFPPQWLDEHPLTRADLEQEAVFLKPADVELTLG